MFILNYFLEPGNIFEKDEIIYRIKEKY